MRHLCNTFIDGGVKKENDWLTALMKDDIDQAQKNLRLSGDITKLFHALAKGLGEGIGLYGKGVGAKSFRPWLKTNHSVKLYLSLTRVDKGVRQDAQTEVRWTNNFPARAPARACVRVVPSE